jgi:hypothetical protein
VLYQIHKLSNSSIYSPHGPHKKALAHATQITDDDINIHALVFIIVVAFDDRHGC